MKIQKFDGRVEQQVLIGMITNKSVLGRISAKWIKGGLFGSKWCNLIGSWCVDYYKKRQEAPDLNIQTIYDRWAEHRNGQDHETTQLIEKLLSFLSSEHDRVKRINPDHIIDLAGEHFNLARFKKEGDEFLAHVENKDLDKALASIAKFRKVELGVGVATDITMSVEEIRDIFRERSESLVRYPGALGQFFGDSLEREGFIAFEGPEKSGKSFLLMDLAWRAAAQRRRVAFFEVGDMSRAQRMKRVYSRIARHPIRAQVVNYPTAITREGNTCTVKIEPRKFDKPLDWRTSRKAAEKFKNRIKSKDPLLQFSFHSTSSISVAGIRNVLDGWELTGWTPDIVVIDYADILAPPVGIRETLDQVNQTWSELRKMSLDLHCLVVTGTQVTRSGYKTNTLKMEHTSQDKRKLAHVTGIIGINIGQGEKSQGIIRLNWVNRRDADFDSDKCVYLAGALAIGNPAIRSTW